MNGDLLAFGNALSQALAKVFASPATRRSSPLSALLVASPVALLLALLAAVVFRSPATYASLAWGGLAGIVGGVGLVLNFRALVFGPVAVVVPVMTCTSTTLLVVASWVIEGRPEVGTLVGAVLCVLAVAVISWGTRDERRQQHTVQTVGYALGAGACLGVSPDVGWPSGPQASRRVSTMAAPPIAITIHAVKTSSPVPGVSSVAPG